MDSLKKRLLIEFEQDFASTHVLTFLEIHFRDQPSHPGLHVHRGQSLHIANGRNVERNIRGSGGDGTHAYWSHDERGTLRPGGTGGQREKQGPRGSDGDIANAWPG